MLYHSVIIHRPMRITSHFYNAVICLIIVNIISCMCLNENYLDYLK